ncbi:MAG: TlpA family protein disulfide reductase [Bacteroidales bacterium]
MQRVLLVLSAIILQFLSCTSQDKDSNRGYIVEVGDMAPDFTVKTIEGETFTLSENRGKVVMLQFTASWCRVCHIEMPHIEKDIWLPLKNKDFVVVGIDRDEPLDVAKKFAKKTGISYPFAIDPGGEVFELYAEKNAGITRNVVINKKGEIVFLTRLFDKKEFAAMKDVIFNLVK